MRGREGDGQEKRALASDLIRRASCEVREEEGQHVVPDGLVWIAGRRAGPREETRTPAKGTRAKLSRPFRAAQIKL